MTSDNLKCPDLKVFDEFCFDSFGDEISEYNNPPPDEETLSYTPEFPLTKIEPLQPQISPQLSISKDHTIIIFDWDDTIMCTTFMAQSNISLKSDSIMVYDHWTELDKLSKSVIEIITTCRLYGEVVIITNAEEGWVQLSAQKFMPELIPILKTLRILSARTAYQKSYPDNCYMWKYVTMKALLLSKRYPPDKKKNIISLGDSLVERLSVINVSKLFPNTLSKSIKFSDRPNIYSLTQQIDLLRGSVKYVAEYDGPLDLQLTVKLGEN